jgi:hypothetical protein
VWKKIFGPKREEVTEEWRRLRNEELHDVYSSPNIIRPTKSITMKRAGHEALYGEGGIEMCLHGFGEEP